MKKRTTIGDLPRLEEMVDAHGLYVVLSMLSDVCSEKSDHLRSNWQDKSGARDWEKAVHLIDEAATKIDAIFK